jgi:hypothetical protein
MSTVFSPKASLFPVITIPKDAEGNPLESNLFTYLPSNIVLRIIQLLPTEDKTLLATVNNFFLKQVLLAMQSPHVGIVDLYTQKKISFEFFLDELRDTQRRMPQLPISSQHDLPTVTHQSMVEAKFRFSTPEAHKQKRSLQLLHLLASTDVIDKWINHMKQKFAQPLEDMLCAELKARSIIFEGEIVDQFLNINSIILDYERKQIADQIIKFSYEEREKYNDLSNQMTELNLSEEKRLEFMMNSELTFCQKEIYKETLIFESGLRKFIEKTMVLIPQEMKDKFNFLLGKILSQRSIVFNMEKIILKIREKKKLHPSVYSSCTSFPRMMGYSSKERYDIPSLLKYLCMLFDGLSSDFETLFNYFLNHQFFSSNSLPYKNNYFLINPARHESVNMLRTMLPIIIVSEDFTAEKEVKESDEKDFMKKLDALEKQIIKRHLVTYISQSEKLTDEELIKILYLLRLDYESKWVDEPSIAFSRLRCASIFYSLVDLLDLSKQTIEALKHATTNVDWSDSSPLMTINGETLRLQYNAPAELG